MKLLASVLPKLHIDLRRRLREALRESSGPPLLSNHTNRLSLVVVLAASAGMPPEREIEQWAAETRDEYRRRLVTAQADQLRNAVGPVLRKIEQTGVERTGGNHLPTIVIRGTPRQLLRALALRDVARADLGDRSMTLVSEKQRFTETVSPPLPNTSSGAPPSGRFLAAPN